MPDQTARDAVAPIVWRHGWVKQEADDFADAVLAVLGIPPEMATSEIARAISTHVQTRAWQERLIAEERSLRDAG